MVDNRPWGSKESAGNNVVVVASVGNKDDTDQGCTRSSEVEGNMVEDNIEAEDLEEDTALGMIRKHHHHSKTSSILCC